MGDVLGLIQKASVLCGLLGLQACSSTGGKILSVVWDAKDAKPAPEFLVDVAQVKKTGLAAIVIEVPSSGLNGVAFATQLRDGRVTYLTSSNRSVTLSGAAVYATRGFGTNLQSVISATDDPVVNMRPFPAWPKHVARSYQIAGTGPNFDHLAVVCVTKSVGIAQFNAMGVERLLELITEDCTATNGTKFQNTYRIDPNTGFVWWSETWTGPEQGKLELTVIEPLD